MNTHTNIDGSFCYIPNIIVKLVTIMGNNPNKEYGIPLGYLLLISKDHSLNEKGFNKLKDIL